MAFRPVKRLRNTAQHSVQCSSEHTVLKNDTTRKGSKFLMVRGLENMMLDGNDSDPYILKKNKNYIQDGKMA